jgi:hypothetical protein
MTTDEQTKYLFDRLTPRGRTDTDLAKGVAEAIAFPMQQGRRRGIG